MHGLRNKNILFLLAAVMTTTLLSSVTLANTNSLSNVTIKPKTQVAETLSNNHSNFYNAPGLAFTFDIWKPTRPESAKLCTPYPKCTYIRR